MKESIISSIEYVERKVRGKLKKEDQGEERPRRRVKQIGENFSWLACPSARRYAHQCGLGKVGHFPQHVGLFQTKPIASRNGSE